MSEFEMEESVPSNTDPMVAPVERALEFEMPEDSATAPERLQELLEAPLGAHHRTGEDLVTFTFQELPMVKSGQELLVDPIKEVSDLGGVQP